MKKVSILVIMSLVIFGMFLNFEVGDENVTASSSWVQTTETDFKSATVNNVTVTSEGEVKLALQTRYIEDNLTDESK